MCLSRKSSIIIDIDNTIIDQSDRKISILNKLSVPIPSNQHFDDDLYLGAELTNTQKRKFEKLVWGKAYFDKLKPILGAVSTLNELSKKHQILYITGRPEAQLTLTLNQLIKFGFPQIAHDCHDNLILCDLAKETFENSPDKINSCVTAWKEAQIARFVEERNGVFVISDSPNDIAAGVRNGAIGIIFKGYMESNQLSDKLVEIIGSPFFAESVVIANNWDTVFQEINLHLHAQTGLLDIVSIHTSEYASFLSDLDAKARLLLTIATFLGTTFFLISSRFFFAQIEDPLQDFPPLTYLTLLLCGIGLISSCLTMIFAIRAFGSRHTRGDDMGDLISIKGISNLIKTATYLFVGKSIAISGTPSHDAMLLKATSHTPMAKLALFAFFKKNYSTVDPNVIRLRRLLDLRALNYKKVYAEVISRRFLFVGIMLAFLCFISLSVSHYITVINTPRKALAQSKTSAATAEQEMIENQAPSTTINSDRTTSVNQKIPTALALGAEGDQSSPVVVNTAPRKSVQLEAPIIRGHKMKRHQPSPVLPTQ